ncbi:MAG TPA: hypothetical protein VIP98_25105 [Microlunatus sp.]
MVQQPADRAQGDQHRPLTPLVWMSIGAALLGWFGFSFAGMPWLTVVPGTLALLTVGLSWLIWFIAQIFSTGRPRPRGWIAAGVILVVAIGAIAVNLPVKARFAASAPAFYGLVEEAGPPPSRLDKGDAADFPVGCPRLVGFYLVDDCETTNGGYLFFDPLGNALVDYAGFAYLPEGPRLESNGGFELQELVHLQGDWYAFAASW